MNQHYSEADLLETYYMQPGESMPVMMHLAGCSECAARYERLERKLRSLAACEHDKPETFWARQRLSIMRKVAQQPQSSSFARRSRFAAAAMLTIVLGGYAAWRTQIDSVPVSQHPGKTANMAAAATPAATEESTSASDSPWQSESLDDYQSMVAWESWVEADQKKKNTGDQPL
jgi:predicted anti-sigma-YlaC factor YlaD